MSARAATVLARHELRILLRQRWVLVYAVVLAVLTAAVSYFGLAVVELTGWQELDRTAASVVSLVLYLVPLATMLLAVQSLRPEGGANEQLFAEPVSRLAAVAGKWLGLSAAHLLATVVGFGFTAALVAASIGPSGLAAYGALAGLTVLCGTTFAAVGLLLAVASGRGLRAYAAVMAAWFVLVLLFDLVVMGVTFVLPDAWAARLAIAGTLVDPVDATRVAAMLAVCGREAFGAAGAHLVRALGGLELAIGVLVAAQVAWTAAALGGAGLLLSRRDV